MSTPAVDVFLLHGQPGGPFDWHAVVTNLPAEFRVHLPDRPGYGRNERPAGGLADNADDLVRRLDDLDVERAIVAGHSWGGGVAIAMAERHPERVAGLVLAASIGPGCLVPVDYLLGLPVIGDALSFVTMRVAAPVVRRRIARFLAEADVAEEHRHRVEETLAANRRRPLWQTFVVEQRAMLRELPGLEEALATVTAPTVVLTGSADRIVPPRTAQALAAGIPGAELRTVDGASHDLPRSAPAAVGDAIAAVAARSCPIDR